MNIYNENRYPNTKERFNNMMNDSVDAFERGKPSPVLICVPRDIIYHVVDYILEKGFSYQLLDNIVISDNEIEDKQFFITAKEDIYFSNVYMMFLRSNIFLW